MKTLALRFTCLAFGIAGLLAGCQTNPVTNESGSTAAPAAPAPTTEAIIDNYSAIAQAAYGDALSTARELNTAVTVFLDKPSAATLQGARDAWLKARIPYLQTEAFRFSKGLRVV